MSIIKVPLLSLKREREGEKTRSTNTVFSHQLTAKVNR